MTEEILKDYNDAKNLLEPIIAIADRYPKETVIFGSIIIIICTIYLRYKK